MMTVLDIHTHRIPDDSFSAIQNVSIKQFQECGSGFFSIGIHPWYIPSDSDSDLESLFDKLSLYSDDKRIVALGETGLDKLCSVPFELQKNVFERQIELAIQKQLPLIIHCVRSFQEIIRLKDTYGKKLTQAWIIHGFRGKKELAEELLRHGFYLSFGQYYHEEVISTVPLSSIFLETDESTTDISLFYQKAANLRGLPLLDFKEAVQQNIQRTFFHS